MENNSIYDYQPLSLVNYYIQEFFEENNVKESKLAFLAQVALPIIGNRHQNIYKYKISLKESTIKNNKRFIPIPCNLDSIEAVLDSSIDEYTYFNSNASLDSTYYTFPTYSNNTSFHNIDCFIHKETREYHNSGNLINYRFNGDSIELSHEHNGDVTVIYRGSLLDKDGMPLVTNSEAIALAFYWNYTNELSKVAKRIGGDGNALALADQLKTLWIARARVPEKFSQNDLNNIKDSLKSRAFSPYGKSMKFGR